MSGADAGLLADVAAAFPAGVAPVGVAVSGGGDSLALLHLMARAGPAGLRAVTVDHRLRPEATAEAAHVAELCAGLGVPHEVVVWDHGGTIPGNLMQAARQARALLISGWAARCGLQGIALGHTADDQAEGVLMALGRGAGLDGLSGMRPLWREAGLVWVRPLLGRGRAELRDYLVRQGIGWCDDPTNEDDRFARARARKALQGLAPLGLSAAKIARSAGLVAQARAGLEAQVARFARCHVTEAGGAVEIARDAFDALHPEMRRLVLLAAIRRIAGPLHPPRGTAQMRLGAAVAAGQGATLAGVRFRVGPRAIRAIREPRAVAGQVVAPGALWDGRWRVTGPIVPGAEVRALGAAGVRALAAGGGRAAGLSRDALVVTPAVWTGERLIAAPMSGFGPEWQASLIAHACSFDLLD